MSEPPVSDVGRPAGDGGAARDGGASWASARQRLRARGLRWTPQRRTLIEVLAGTDGHVTGAELVERCRAIDPATIPSTVYRTLDVLEDVGLVSHSHGADGREEFHVLPENEHGHLRCLGCGETWEVGPDEARALLEPIRDRHDVVVDLSHLSIAGWCGPCREAGGAEARATAGDGPPSDEAPGA